ncbi:MAG TPA: 50S ribosomal protein L6 [Flavobacteriales bacterium]|jgi:large subunit ribosomal protein L6|nr:50S ribosomal protein L6 [Flavobacteriales bacterium]HIN41497.1 50S ribosomal protein L6 [Flavobacteriales bacterium]
MSRIGKAPITIPEGVTLTVENSVVTVKGSKGELTQQIDSSISVAVEDNIVTLSRSSNDKEFRSKHGLYRALIFNMIEGVSKGYTKELELYGVGFRASSQGQQLTLSLGYSHAIVMELPTEVKLLAETKKGKPPYVKLESHDKQLIGIVAAKIRSLRKPEPYKGKGIRYKGEEIRRKAGKTAAK